MSERNIRRHHRISHTGPVRLSWQDRNGETKYTRGTCLDASENGLRIETAESLPVRTAVSLSADRLSLTGSATVKHVVRRGVKYILGLEFNQAQRSQALALALAAEVADNDKPLPAA